jgi:hypothetical protein
MLVHPSVLIGTVGRSPEVSLGPFDASAPNLQNTPRVSRGLRGSVPTRPERVTPPLGFLFVAPRLRSTLPSDIASRRCPCALLLLRPHVPGERTCTSEHQDMPGTHGSRWSGAGHRVRCSDVILIEVPSSACHGGMLSRGNDHSHEEETSGDSTPHRTNFMVASTGTPAPCSSASSTGMGRSSCTGICQLALAPVFRPSRPLGRTLSSVSNACSPGTWLADLCAQQGIPFILGHAL